MRLSVGNVVISDARWSRARGNQLIEYAGLLTPSQVVLERGLRFPPLDDDEIVLVILAL